VNINNNSIKLILKIIPNIHLWKGGTPNLNKIAIILSTADNEIESPNIMEIKNTTEADLWEMKYFTPVITESSFDLPSKIGIIHNILTSKHTHWSSKLSTLSAPRMHPNKIRKYPNKELK